jgi:tetratricopeptide (TPR) repeat protein
MSANAAAQEVLDRLIEEGLTLYGQGDLDGALVLWERVLAEDPGNAQATSYVDYVRTNYDTLTAEGREGGDVAPLPLVGDADPGYVIELTAGEATVPGVPSGLARDDVDAGWEDEAADDAQTLDLEAANPEALRLESFDDATREYDPSMRKGPEDAFTEKEQTGVRRRDLGFVRPIDFDAPTREHTAPTRELPAGLDALVTAPTRELGLRQLAAMQPEAAPRDPVEARAAEVLAEIDVGAPEAEPEDERTRRRITTLLERAAAWCAAGDLERAVTAIDLALAEDADSALAQKLVTRHRDTTLHVFQAFLGDMAHQPVLARPLHELASARISPRAAFLLSRVDGTLTIDEILDVSGMPRLEAYRYLCQLLLRGILR